MTTILPPAVAKCPLFKLPPELRDQIYDYAVRLEPRISCPDEPLDYDYGTVTYHALYSAAREPALLATCRIIRDEAQARLRALPSYIITVHARFNTRFFVSFWIHRIEQLLSQYTVVCREVKTRFDVEGHGRWARMTQGLREAQRRFVSGRTQTLEGTFVNDLDEGFTFKITVDGESQKEFKEEQEWDWKMAPYCLETELYTCPM